MSPLMTSGARPFISDIAAITGHAA